MARVHRAACQVSNLANLPAFQEKEVGARQNADLQRMEAFAQNERFTPSDLERRWTNEATLSGGDPAMHCIGLRSAVAELSAARCCDM